MHFFTKFHVLSRIVFKFNMMNVVVLLPLNEYATS